MTPEYEQWKDKVLNHRILTKREERNLLVRAQKGDVGARDKLLAHNMRFIFSLVLKWSGLKLSEEDRFSEGIIGFLHAVEKFDTSTTFRLTTYSRQWVVQYMQRADDEQSHIIRSPTHRVERQSKIARTQHEFQVATGRKATTAEMAEMLGVAQAWVEEYKAIRYVDSLDRPLSQNQHGGVEGEITLHDIVEGDDMSPEDIFLQQWELDSTRVQDAIVTICKPRQARVLQLRLGIGSRPHTLEEVAELMGCTRENIRQIEEDALGLLSLHKKRWMT